MVSVGRNIAGTSEALPETSWAELQAEIQSAAESIGAVVFAGIGQGTDPTTGRLEQSATLVIVADDGLVPGDFEVFEGYLAAVARAYDQESIAVTYGQTRFVKGG